MIGLVSFTEGWGKIPELNKFVSLLLHSSDRVIILSHLFISDFKNILGDEVELRAR